MQEQHRPDFSVVIPTYNRADLVSRAIESVLRQSFPSLEVIVVDDGSTDATAEVAAHFDDPRVKYLQEDHVGGAEARNRGVHASTGRYVAFLDSDDEAMPGWLAQLLEGFEKHAADIVCCGFLMDYREIGKTPPEKVRLPYNMGGLFGNRTAHFQSGAFAMRRELFEEVGGYTPGLPSGHHTDFALRLMPLMERHGWKIHNLMVPLVRSYVHRGERIRSNPEAVLEGTKYLLSAHGAALAKFPKRHAKSYAVAGVAAAQLERYAEARAYFLHAIRAYPFRRKYWARLLASSLPGFARRVWR